MKRLVVALAVVLGLGALVWYLRGRDVPANDTTGSSSAAATESQRVAPGTRDSLPPTHVIRLASKAERRRLAERIADARAARAAQRAGTPAAPAEPERSNMVDLEHVGTNLKDALSEAIPILADCYKIAAPDDAKREKTAAVMMTLVGDPDIGTLIDADQMVDQNEHPLDPKLDACLRDTLESLELPPLAQGDKLDIKYSFVFE